MSVLILRGCIYDLTIKGRLYVGQSRRLDSERLPTKRWKRHIADSKTPKTAVHAAIHDNGGVIDAQSVLEYIEQPIYASKLIITRLLNKTKIKKALKKFTGMLQCLLAKTTDSDCDESDEEENEPVITLDISLSPKEKLVIDSINSFIDLVNNAEIKWVKEKNSMIPKYGGNGYNHAPPGGALPHEPHTEEWKQDMSNKMKGRIISEEARAKISKARTGSKCNWSDETRARVAEATRRKATGVVMTDEQKAKISQSLKGRPGVTKGQKRSEEQKQRIGAASKGRVFSDECKKKMSEERRARFQITANSQCRMNDEDIHYIRNNPDNLTKTQLSEKYNCKSVTTITNIINRKSYNHIPEKTSDNTIQHIE